MSSFELDAGTVSECQPSLFVIHSPEGGSTSDVTSEHTQSQSRIETSISTADNRKGNDEKKSVSSVKAVREKGTSKNRAISTPRPLHNSGKIRKNKNHDSPGRNSLYRFCDSLSSCSYPAHSQKLDSRL